MKRIGLVLTTVALLLLVSVGSVEGQDPESMFDNLVSIIDDTTCGDGIGRTFRTTTLYASANEGDETKSFFEAHEACAGVSGIAADFGLTPLPVGLLGQCSDAIVLPGWNSEWVICTLAFYPRGDGTQPVRIELKDFALFTPDGQRFDSYTGRDLYVGQMNDISGGVDLVGTKPIFGEVAFPVSPGAIDGPFMIGWLVSGDFLIADELEPKMGEFFVRDMQGG